MFFLIIAYNIIPDYQKKQAKERSCGTPRYDVSFYHGHLLPKPGNLVCLELIENQHVIQQIIVAFNNKL
jgi:hypothetical protein